ARGDGGVVREDVGSAVLGGNEAEALLGVETLHGAHRHDVLFSHVLYGQLPGDRDRYSRCSSSVSEVVLENVLPGSPRGRHDKRFTATKGTTERHDVSDRNVRNEMVCSEPAARRVRAASASPRNSC